jgi:hypothetical protein
MADTNRIDHLMRRDFFIKLSHLAFRSKQRNFSFVADSCNTGAIVTAILEAL